MAGPAGRGLARSTSDTPFELPSGRGTPRLVNANDTGRCPVCVRSFKRRADGGLIAHEASRQKGQERCPGSLRPPAEDPALSAWLPVKAGLAPHGLRHSHKTWMVEGGVPEILAELRLGHEVPGMRGLYSHVSQRMREDLKQALQARWGESLNERVAEASRDRMKKNQRGGRRNLASRIPPNNGSDTVGDVA